MVGCHLVRSLFAVRSSIESFRSVDSQIDSAAIGVHDFVAAVADGDDVAAVVGKWPHFGSIGSSTEPIDAMEESTDLAKSDTGMHSYCGCATWSCSASAIAATIDAGADALEWLRATGSARRLQPLLLPLPLPVGN